MDRQGGTASEGRPSRMDGLGKDPPRMDGRGGAAEEGRPSRDEEGSPRGRSRMDGLGGTAE